MTHEVDLVTGLRAWTKNHDAHVRAAVELLIEHDHWLYDDVFIDRCVSGNNGIACIDFAAAWRYHQEGPASSEGQLAMLLVIADIGWGRWKTGTLDVRNRDRVARAVMLAVGAQP